MNYLVNDLAADSSLSQTRLVSMSHSDFKAEALSSWKFRHLFSVTDLGI